MRPRQPPSQRLESLLGRDTVVRGGIDFAGALLVEGRVVGPVQGPHAGDVLIVGEHGVVEGAVHVGVARIDGRVDGEVIAVREVRVGARGHVAAAVRAPRVLVAPGGRIDGQVLQLSNADKREPSFDLPGLDPDAP